MSQAFITAAKDALNSLREVIQEAIRLLPDEVNKQYWITRKHSPTPWNDVVRWYQAKEDYEPQVGNTLVLLKDLSQAREHLFALVTHAEAEQRKPNLTLAKVRVSHQ